MLATVCEFDGESGSIAIVCFTIMTKSENECGCIVHTHARYKVSTATILTHHTTLIVLRVAAYMVTVVVHVAVLIHCVHTASV